MGAQRVNDVPAPVADVLARISTLRAEPAAVNRIRARFESSIVQAVATSSAQATNGTLTPLSPNPGLPVGRPVAVSAAPAAGPAPGATTPAVGSTPGERAVGEWAARLPEAGRPWATAIEDAAQRNGLDPAYLAACIWTESGFQPQVVSAAGAIGLGQLMPATAAYLGVDPWDPVQNIDGAARYYKAQIDRFGSVELGTAAYMAGPTAVARAGAIPSERAEAYVARILGRQAFLEGRAATAT